MANSTENRINTTITDPNITAITDAFTAINVALEGSTVGLTEEERKSLFSMDVENKEFVTDCYAQGVLLNSKLPPALQVMVANLKSDLGLNLQYENIEDTLLLPLVLRIADTKRLAAHEAYVGALSLYKVIEAMAGMGVEGFQASFEVLKKRFEGQGGSKPAPTL